MPTIKTTAGGSNKLIVTKLVNGQQRVSCSCCDVTCCLYPAEQLGGLYGPSDLPESVTVNWPETKTLDKNGSGYSKDGITLAVNELDKWEVAQGQNIRSVGACLINGASVTDLFADSYQVEAYGGFVTAYRVALCAWEGIGFIDGIETAVLIYYGNGFLPDGALQYFDPPYDFGDNLKWNIVVATRTPPFLGSDGAEKNAPHNSPAGDYESITQAVFTVS